MFTTLEELKEQDLRRYTLAELIKVLEALNSVSLSQMNYVTATETLDSYLAFVDTINERINSGTLKGIDTKQKTELLQYIKKLRDRLNNFKVLSSFMLANQRTFYLYVDKMKNETAEKINKTTTEPMPQPYHYKKTEITKTFKLPISRGKKEIHFIRNPTAYLLQACGCRE